MTQTICDICRKPMTKNIFAGSVIDSCFSISRCGVRWDICNDCRKDLTEWIDSRRNDIKQNAGTIENSGGFDEAVKKIMDEYEPYRKDVIMIKADV